VLHNFALPNAPNSVLFPCLVPQSVVNFTTDKDMSAYKVLHLALKDSEDSNLLCHLPSAYTFIHGGARQGGGSRILIFVGQQFAVPPAQRLHLHSWRSEAGW
jgi:hypothetical protein